MHALGRRKVLRAGPAPLTLVSLGRWACWRRNPDQTSCKRRPRSIPMPAFFANDEVQAATISAIAAVLGVLLGAAATWYASLAAERKRWEREDQVRFVDARRALYAEFLGEVSKAVNSSDPETGRMSPADMLGMLRTLAAIELVATDEVAKAAAMFAKVVDAQLSAPRSHHYSSSAWGDARRAFIASVRKELGVTSPRPEHE